MKMTISWHEECIKNQRLNFLGKEEQLKRHSADVERFRLQLEFSEKQLAEAKRRGVEGYDNERFLKKRGVK